MSKPKAEPATQSVGLKWRWHGLGENRRRVWNTQWPGDSFCLVGPSEWPELVDFCVKFGIPIEEADDD